MRLTSEPECVVIEFAQIASISTRLVVRSTTGDSSDQWVVERQQVQISSIKTHFVSFLSLQVFYVDEA